MMKKYSLLVLLLIFIVGCSSHTRRAPVRDITLNSGSNHNSMQGRYHGASAYTVEPGDTITLIAWKTGLSKQQLVSRNNLKNANEISQGQVLNLKQNQTVKKYRYSDQGSKNNKKSSKPQQKVEYQKRKTYAKTYSESSQKIASWSWPSNGELIKKFSPVSAGLQGISIKSTRGSAVKSAADGKVVYAGSGLRGYGNLIIIKHNSDYLSAYAHNEKLLAHENQTVKKGQKIALMGDSGTNAVYLHFEIRYKGKSVDPLRYLPKK